MCKIAQVGQRSYYKWKSGSVSEKTKSRTRDRKGSSIYFDSRQRY
jgi:hypothetical protein